MFDRLKNPTPMAALALTVGIGLVGCTGPLDEDRSEEGMIPTEIKGEDNTPVDPMAADAPKMVAEPDGRGTLADDLAGPKRGADALPDGAVGAGAEPGQPIEDGPTVRANQATRGGGY